MASLGAAGKVDCWAESVKAAFREADVPRSGLISRRDLRKVLEQVDGAGTLAAGELEGLLDCFELQDDGRLAYEAFVDWLAGPDASLSDSGDLVKVSLSAWLEDLGESQISLDVPWGTTAQELLLRLEAERSLRGCLMQRFTVLAAEEPLVMPRRRMLDLAVALPSSDVAGNYYFPQGAVPGATVLFRNVRQGGHQGASDILDYLEGTVVRMTLATRTMVFFWRKHVGKGYTQFQTVYSASWAARGPGAAAPFSIATGLQLKRCQEPPFALPDDVQELMAGMVPADEAEGRLEQLSGLLSSDSARRTELRLLLQDHLPPDLVGWDAKAAEEALAWRLGCRAEGSLTLLLATAVGDVGSLRTLMLEGGSTLPFSEEAGCQESLAFHPSSSSGQGALLLARRREGAERDELQVKRGTYRHLGAGELLCDFAASARRDAQCWHEWQVKPLSANDKEMRIDLKRRAFDPSASFLRAVQAGKDWMGLPQMAQAARLAGWETL